jgi:hypothetical protein
MASVGASVRWGRMSRWLTLLLVVCACAVGLVACGDDTDDASVGSILEETFGKGKEVKSGKLDMSIKLDAKGVEQLSGPISAKLTGPFQSSGKGELPKFAFTAAIDLAGQQLKAGVVSTGDKGFVSFQDQNYAVSDEMFKQFKTGYAEQAKCSEKQDGGSSTFSALGVKPRTWLVDAKKSGVEKVGGAEATHITASIDTAKFLDDINTVLGKADPQAQADPCAKDAAKTDEKTSPTQLTEAQRKTLTDSVKSAKVNIWTGKDDRTMRRMNVTIDFTVPESARKQASGLQSGKLTFDLTIAELNKDQTIKAPSKSQPLENLIAALQNGQQAPSAGGAGASGGNSSKYEQCMADAGQDVKKLQDCAALIGQ